MDKPVETLKNMNAQTAKHASWVVRILSPKLVRYGFASKGKQVEAEKFLCVLVSANPTQFMTGSVPFSFVTPDAAKKAFEKFKSGTCFRVQQPEFDGKLKPEYMSTSIKRALLLTMPTMISAVPLTATDTLKDLVNHVDVGMTMTQVLERLNKVS